MGPLVIKGKSYPPIVEKLLKVMNFQGEKIIYYPHQIISQRRQKNKNEPYEHQIVEGLDKMANMENFDQDQQMP